MREVTVQILGCGDAFGSGGRLNTCFHVNTGSLQFLIDCGATSLVAIKKNYISAGNIDIIVITHFHGDHFGGLPFIIIDAMYEAKRTKPLIIISPPGCKQKLNEAMNLYYPGLSDALEDLQIKFIEYHPYQTIRVNSFILQAFPVMHTAATSPHAVRINVENKIIGFSGDTEWTDELIEVAKDTDLFICECNFFETQVKGHLNYKTLMENIAKLTCKTILLTHLGNEMLHNLSNVTLNCAQDGQVIIL